MVSFNINTDNNVVVRITGTLFKEIIPLVEYIAVYQRLSVVFKDYLKQIYKERYEQLFQRKFEGLEYSSIEIDASSIQILLK